MKLTPALEKQIQDMGAEAIEVATDSDGITFSVGDIAFGIQYGTGSAKKFVVNGNNWDDANKSYTGSYRVGQSETLAGAVNLCKSKDY